jgi:hypothetical protein
MNDPVYFNNYCFNNILTVPRGLACVKNYWTHCLFIIYRDDKMLALMPNVEVTEISVTDSFKVYDLLEFEL